MGRSRSPLGMSSSFLASYLPSVAQVFPDMSKNLVYKVVHCAICIISEHSGTTTLASVGIRLGKIITKREEQSREERGSRGSVDRIACDVVRFGFCGITFACISHNELSHVNKQVEDDGKGS